MKKFNHSKIITDTLSVFSNLRAVKQAGNNAYEFEDTQDNGMPVGRLEIIPSTKNYLYTIYLSFYDNKYLNIKDSILNAYKEQKRNFTIPFNAIIEDRNDNKGILI